MSVCFTACQDDLHEVGGQNGNALVLLVGGEENFISTRSEANPQFQEGTLFHLYGTNIADDNEIWGTNYLNSNGTGTDVTKAKTSSLTKDNARLLEGEGLAKVFNAKPLNLYGVAVVGAMADKTDDTAAQIAANNALLDSYQQAGGQEGGVPQYNVTYTKAQESDTYMQAMPDIMWSDSLKGLTPRANAGDNVMPFVHTLSKLNFHAVLAEDLPNTYEGIKITSITLHDYPSGILSMANGYYQREAAMTRSALADAASFSDVALTKDEALPFATTLAFPTEGAVYEFSDEEVENEPIQITLSIAYGTTEKSFIVPLTYEKDKNQVFKPNHEYDITFSITTSSVIVTLVPRYYEVTEDINLFDFELGEPIDFGGVLWAAQNLGATSSDPTMNAYSWERSRGFYYQLGRSIPYFVRGSMEDPYPNVSVYDKDITYNSTNAASWWDGELNRVLYTDEGLKQYGLTENIRVPYGRVSMGKSKTHGSRAYPYIPVLWETVKKKGGQYTDYLAGTRAYMSDYTNGQSAPADNISDPYYAKNYVNNDLETLKTNLRRFAMSSYNSRAQWHNSKLTATDNWIYSENGVNSPAPKGWRLPTEDDFLSIIPADQIMGDIAFTKHAKYNEENADTEEKGMELNQRTFRYVSDDEGKKDYKNENAIYVGIYQDGSGYNDLGTTHFNDNNYNYYCKEGWGSVFGIKRYETDDAYLIRWQIEIADLTEVKNGWVIPARFDIDAKEQPYIGRGVLVISKYDIHTDDKKHLCIDYEKVEGVPTWTADNKEKRASHICRVFLDYDKDEVWDNTKNADGTLQEDTVEVDWDRPSGQLKLPISGYMYVHGDAGQALFYPGSEGIYWIATKGTNGNEGQTVRIKFSGDYSSRWIEMYKIEVPVNGCQIRCVRDENADYE